MVMEYLEGGTLSDARRGHEFEENEIAYVAKEVSIFFFGGKFLLEFVDIILAGNILVNKIGGDRKRKDFPAKKIERSEMHHTDILCCSYLKDWLIFIIWD